jgi:hypothetical protein
MRRALMHRSIRIASCRQAYIKFNLAPHHRPHRNSRAREAGVEHAGGFALVDCACGVQERQVVLEGGVGIGR